MAADILSFALAPGRQEQSPTGDPAPQIPGTTALDRAGSAPADAAPRRRVPADAILAIGRGMPHAACRPDAAPAPVPARRRMERKHKLMLVTAAAVLYLGGSEAHRTFKPRAVLIEVPNVRTNAITALPLRMPAA
ncbi:hypothetical protein SAMN02799631_03441 [Methylobacterium sp. 174MFSha1.1]|uniref:hypothetical protein n=1 Tax=Methylobacterium sp. 174MFSha1.1 TaxID=1502749 RepID=UPI0008E629F4|nr:hypothetical protein [Methylobacterium sp. 174MFSha1.1]SFU95762.1 hypothetical protein SAMN02799631_03441 [Methylobacterium sp. 174MFSha1.1]